MTTTALARARAGDEDAFRELTDPYRRELQVHCYRILGSVQDAEDLLQETLLAAWRGLDQFEGRSSLRAWLYRIATNRCLNALRDTGRRPRPRPAPAACRRRPSPPAGASRCGWSPTRTRCSRASPTPRPGPEARYETKEAVALAFVAGLQHLPPAPARRARAARRARLPRRRGRRRCSTVSEASVNSALQRARATLDARLPAAAASGAPLPRSPRERELASRFADAFEGGDVDGLVALLTDDAWLTMPPQPHRVPGPRGDRRVLPRPGDLARGPACPARADARQRPARVRPLHRRPAHAGRAAPSASSC